MAILSIQSRVVAGYVGNSAAAPALQRLGHDVWAVDTVAFSHHPAHGAHRGRVRSARELRDLIAGLAADGRLADCAALLSGYLGKAATGQVVLEVLAGLRAANANLLYLCDPVIGDRGSVYVEPGLVEFFRLRLAPRADILTPNAFEAGLLAGRHVDGVEAARSAADALRALGAGAVVVTGLERDDRVTTLAVDGDGAWRVTTPRVDAPSYGAGDLFAALLLAHRLAGRALPDCVARAASSVHAALAGAAASGARDLPVVASLDRIVSPAAVFTAARLS